jgi:hypothetical protein
MDNFAVVSEERRRRLKEMLAQLERLPASPERDRMLREVRSRAVDLDTGVSPRPLLPVDAPMLGPRRPPPQRLAGDRGSATRGPAPGDGGR